MVWEGLGLKENIGVGRNLVNTGLNSIESDMKGLQKKSS